MKARLEEEKLEYRRMVGRGESDTDHKKYSKKISCIKETLEEEGKEAEVLETRGYGKTKKKISKNSSFVMKK